MPVQINPCLVYSTGYPDKHLVMDMPTFQRMLWFLRESPALVWDFETSGLDWFKHARACGVGLGGWKRDGTLDLYYVPFRHATGEKQLTVEQIGPFMKELLGDPNKLKIAHNMKFDEHFANVEGWEVAGPRYDTMIAARLYDENRKAGLKIRAVQDLGREDAQMFEKRINEEVYRLAKAHGMPVAEYRNAFGYSQINIPLCGTYCCFDLEFTAHLHLFYEAAGISRLYSRIWQTEMELIGVLTRMEARGMAIDTGYLETLRDALGGVLASLEDSIWHQLGGFKFNLSSDGELREVLMQRLGIRLSKLTKKGQYAVDKEVLAQHVNAHPVLKQIIDWREAEKLRSTYTNSILARLDSELTLHSDYQQVGTFTGRLSCMNPNFQNQPSDSDDRAQKFSGKSLEDGGRDPWSIRRAYVVGRSGWVRLYFDYSQIELRVLAYYSGDPVMVEAYVNGEDIHERTSLEVFGTKEKAKRRPSKVINFGLCVAEGQKVLTFQNGLVPIEQIKDWHKVWDGIQWVKHDGLVCRGECEVVTYEGLTATPEHEVYLDGGGKVSIGDLASKICSGRLAIGEVEALPVRYTWFDGEDAFSRAKSDGTASVPGMSENSVGLCGQHKAGANDELSLPKRKIPRFTGEGIRRSIRCYGSAMPERYARFVRAIQGSRDQGAFQVARALCSLGASCLSEIRFSRFGFRPNRQQRSLLPKKSASGLAQRESAKQVAVVYDLLNAGPRHRYTVSGKIVSNSYCMTAKGYSMQTGIPLNEAEKHLDKFFQRYHGIMTFRNRFWDEVRRRGGYFQNIFGRPRKIKTINSNDEVDRTKAERRAIATIIQGTAAELTKESLVKVDRFLRERDLPAYIVATVHDEIQIDCELSAMAEVSRGVKAIMEDFPMFAPIPIIVDCEYSMTSWADKSKVQL